MFLLIVNRAINLLFEAIPSRQFAGWGQMGKKFFFVFGDYSCNRNYERNKCQLLQQKESSF